jgi:hypothetical protein
MTSKQWSNSNCGYSGPSFCAWTPLWQQASEVPAAQGRGVAFDNSFDLVATRQYNTVVDNVDPGMNSYVEGCCGLGAADGSSQLSGKNLRPGAVIKINACFAGSGGSDSIAYAISKQLGRETHAYDGGTHFGPTDTGSDGKPYPPTHPPVYLLPDKGTKEVVFP